MLEAGVTQVLVDEVGHPDRVRAQTAAGTGSVRVVVVNLVFYAVTTVGLVVSFAVGGVNLGLLVGSLGLATVALGFALQDIVSNFTAGIVLLLEHPFTEGDHIAIAEAEGEVEEIRVRATRLRAPDGQLLVVPNKLLFTQVVRNSTATMRRRVEVLVEVPYGQDPAPAYPAAPRCLRSGRGAPGEEA